MQYIQSTASTTSQNDLMLAHTSINKVAPPKIVRSTSVILSVSSLEAFGIRSRWHCAELSTGKLVSHPVTNATLPGYLELLKRITEEHPSISFKNPEGKTLTFDLQAEYKTLAAFDGMVRYYDPDTAEIVKLPAREVPSPYAFRLLPCGGVVMTDPNVRDSKTEKIVTNPINLAAIHDASLAILTITDPDLLGNVPTVAMATAVHSQVQVRIAAAFSRYVQNRSTTFEERAEVASILQYAPYHDAAAYVKGDNLMTLTLEQKVEVMRMYHRVPGSIPPVHYDVLIRLG